MRVLSQTALFLGLLAVMRSPAAADEPKRIEPPRFLQHTIDADAVNPACAAMDVDADGQLDIVAGGFWYQAPTWKRRFLRDVEQIRGRNDDYSCLPLDVNGDGRLDLISVNYRSQSLYWVEHPGEKLADDVAWKKHVIDTPGPAETGRLVDVDGDGRLDVLPNGVKYSAWYELQPPQKKGEEASWIAHPLPPEAAAHGLGFGDIDGDGRGDLVSPVGWFAAPEDRRTGRWTQHAEFQLHRDASVPILVHDVDGDGDADLIWGRGHGCGLYWLEQAKADDGSRSWTQHAIDTSWSQAHTLLLADLDNDGAPELIAGKRFMGHEGNNLGEYDPLAIYGYQLSAESRTWRRFTIAKGAGFDLDAKAVDIDQDGDLDLVASTRGGLWLLENQLTGQKAPTAPAAPIAYKDHRRVMYVNTPEGKETPVETPFDWARRREHIQQGMQLAMGDLPGPERRTPLDVEYLESVETEKYIRHKITYASEPGDRTPAYLLVPKNLQGKVPGILCLHPTSHLGKAQIVGLDGLPSRFYAHELAELGFVCLAPDYPSFGDYKDYDFEADAHESGTMKAIWTNIRGLDLLETLPQVDGERLGCIGHSLGGHNALYTSVFDLRIKAVATSCGFNAFHYYKGGDLKGWTSTRYMPRILDQWHASPDEVPFDFHEVLAAIAPRPIFVNAPLHDSNFDVVGVREAIGEAEKVYDLLQAKGALEVVYPDAQHDFPEPIRQQTYAWLKKQLK
ncbi:FG-GAP-like repeat-containing protein [Lignipirellula cremea]|uniref:FG-GAP repeat protein n=1 Tax=Lignipirellula cremea TaxID=2528010 RepID=A0A518E0X3_9BACT|nr:FG-GAP-like repeat-containing protein [Lignipirellula cremea]QDU97733.1 FG-GAP repeat protein [Lignipirellula cremea]